MNTIYPVGSLYFGTQSTCPLQSAGIGTWTRVAINFVTGATAPVIGNGMTLGFTNGTNNYGLNFVAPSATDRLTILESAYGKDVGTTTSGKNTNPHNITIGLTTDPEKSGLVSNLPTYTVNVWRRTA